MWKPEFSTVILIKIGTIVTNFVYFSEKKYHIGIQICILNKLFNGLPSFFSKVVKQNLKKLLWMCIC